jgi:superfamily II DNA or RNA helicase
MLRELKLNPVYRSDSNNIVKEFYIPTLSCSLRYDRAVGFFSASMLSLAAQGIGALIRNGGTMRLIVSSELAPDEAGAIRDGYHLRELAQQRIEDFFEKYYDLPEFLFQNRLRALSWMIAANRLDVKVAFKQQGMYHEKIGIIYDKSDFIVFQGSANESAAALNPDYNFESINVFPSWKNEFAGYTEPYVQGFENLWNNKTPNVHVIKMPDASRQLFTKIASEYRPSFTEEEAGVCSVPPQIPPSESVQPKVPEQLGGKPFELFSHQRIALTNWRSQDGAGLFELATGAGKTITALYGAVKIFEHAKKLFLIIAVPYQNLADQWVEEACNFGIHALKCYHSKSLWEDRARSVIDEFRSNQRKFACFITVNRTLTSPLFQELLKKIDGDFLFFIGDECHHHESPSHLAALPTHARYRIGLSATLEQCDSIKNYYGKIIYTYSLENALQDNVLTPYDYHVHCIDLTERETAEYLDLTSKIKKAFAIDSESDQLKTLLLARARLLGSAVNKLTMLRTQLLNAPKQSLTLFYCGDGTTESDTSDYDERQIDLVSKLLHEIGWRSSRFTSYESKENRKAILNCFKSKSIDALVAIRCLDEGIDIPACKTAYILASSSNPRQQIQRRGRILRRAPGKDFAIIHDYFVRLPHSKGNEGIEKKLVERELKRIFEFAHLARNTNDSIKKLASTLEESDLDYLLYNKEWAKFI